MTPRDLALARGAERRRHDRGSDGRSVRAADGQLRAGGRRRLPEGLLSRPGGRRAQPVPRHDQAAHVPVRLRRAARRRRRTSSPPAMHRRAGRHRGQRGAAARRTRRQRAGRSCAWPRSQATELRLGAPTARRCIAATCPTPCRSTSSRRSRLSRYRARARAVRLVPRARRATQRGARCGVEAMQRSLRAAWPGLRHRLLVRDDGAGARPGWKPTRALAAAASAAPESTTAITARDRRGRERIAGIDAALDGARATRSVRRVDSDRPERSSGSRELERRSERAQHLDVGDAGLVELRRRGARSRRARRTARR